MLEAPCALDCGGKRKCDTAFREDFRRASAVTVREACAPSEGGVALTLPAAVQGCAPRADFVALPVNFPKFILA